MVTKFTRTFLFMTLLACLCSYHANAQLSGTITVPNATYATLDSVIKALNTVGVGTGGLTINLTAGNPQTAPAGGYQLGSTILNASLSAVKPLVINGNGNTVTAYTGTGTADGIFTIKGADYVTINQLHLAEAAANTTTTTQMEWGYGMVKLNASAPFDGCQYNTISGCNITLSRANAASPTGTSYGGSKGVMLTNWVLSAPATQLTITAASDAHNNNTIKGCNIQNVNFGVFIWGYNASSPYTLYDQNNTVGGYGVNDGNTITNYGGAAYESAGIYLYGYESNALVRGNTVNNMSNGGVAGANVLDGIYQGSASAANTTIRKNNVSLTQGSVTSAVQGIITYCGAGGATNVMNIDSNTLSITGNGSSHITYCYYMPSTAAADTLNFNANQLTATTASTGTMYCFYVAMPSVGTNPVFNINDNKLTSLNRTATSGTTYCFYQTGSVLGGTLYNQQRNKVTGVTYASGSSGAFYANYIYGGTGTYAIRNIAYDTVSNVSTGSGTMYSFYTYNYGAGSTYNNNYFSGITTSGTQYHIYFSSSTVNATTVYNNTVSNIVNNSTSAFTYGLYLSSAVSMDVYNNTITNMQSAQTTGSAIYGMYFSSATLANIYNNMISDIRTPAGSSTSPIYGMFFNGGTAYNVYHNTINLNPVSTGTDFGATGIYYNSGITSFDLRNNIIRVNATPAGAGFIAALRRSSGTAGVVPSNLAATSNGNVYYAPNATNSYLYAEGTGNPLLNAYNLTNDANFNTPCGAYKSFMSPRENASFTENNLTQIGTTATFAPTASSYAKSVGVPTTAPAVTLDFNGVTRATPADAGALQFAGTALDAAPPIISYIPLPVATYCLSAPVLNAVITDVSGVNTNTNAPRVYYRKSSEADAFGTYPASNVSGFNGWKYVTATNTGNNFSFAIDYSKLTAAPVAGDTIIYFVVAQDNAATPNVGVNTAGFATGYCPASVNLTAAAGPTASAITKNYYRIQAQPALPTVTPASSTVCQGTGVKLTAGVVSGPLTATIGTGSIVNATSTYPAPYGQYYGSSHEQYLILASELTAQGLTAGNMTSLSFNLSTGYSYAALQNYAVKMANTTTTSLGANFISTGFTTVYTNTAYTPPGTAGWAAVTFSTPFVWDGVSNVVVDVSFSNCSVCNGTSSCTTSYTNNGIVNQTATSFVSTLNYHYDGNCTINTFAPTGTFITASYNQRPNMQIGGTQRFSVNWTPVTGLYKDSLLTQPVTSVDTNSVVYAAPAATTAYAPMNVFSGCNSLPATVPATVNVTPAPPTTTIPAGTASFCGGSSATITGPSGSNLSYQWKLAGIPITGATSQAYTATAIGVYTLTVTNTSTGCSATSPAVNVVNSPAQTAAATATGATTVCGGSSVTINANTGTGLTYQWMNSGSPISGATTATYAATASGNYAVVVTNSNNCSATSTAIPVTVNTVNANVTANGPTTFCTGGSVVISVPSGASQTYQWKLNGNNITGATGTNYTAAASGNYTVLVTNTGNGCSATSAAMVITVGNGPTSAITPTGTVGICPGSSTTLSAFQSSGVTYQWSLNGTAISGATGTTYSANAAGNYTVTVSSGPGCNTTSAATNVLVNPAPSVATTPSGAAGVCQNSTITLSVPTGTGFTYQWKQGGVNISGATGSTYTTGTAGNYTVTVVNPVTTCSATSANIPLTVNPLPAASATAGSPLTICANDSAMLIANSGTGLTYQWKYNGAGISGANGISYAANQAGSYTVQVTNSFGCSSNSNALVLNVNPVPVSTITYTSPITFCEGGAVVLQSNTGTGYTYQWLLNGQPLQNAVNSFNISYLPGNYTVKITTSLGCYAVSQPVSITVNPLPQPVITKTGFVLSTGSFASYQWYRDGQVFPNGTGPGITATQNGAYSVTVTDSNGCRNSSTIMFVNNVGITAPVTVSDIKVYPNPSHGIVYIDAPIRVNIAVRDLSGRVILAKEDAKQADLNGIADGVYMILISDQEGRLIKTEKLFKSE